MKKIVLAFLLTTGIFAVSFSQPVAMEGRVEYQRGDKSAAMIELPYEADVVEAAIRETMLKQGVKEQRTKGFQVFKGAKLDPADTEVSDLYFKVDRKSRKDPASLVYLIVGKPNENVGLRAVEDMYKVNDGKAFLNEIIPAVEARNLQVGIGKQDDVIGKAEKKLKNLQDDQRSMEKRIKDLQDKLVENKRDQEAQAAELDKQRSVKQAMQARQTPSDSASPVSTAP